MPLSIDINGDAGESYGRWTLTGRHSESIIDVTFRATMTHEISHD